MDKKKAKDPQIWKRLGLELAALHDLIVEIMQASWIPKRGIGCIS